MVLIFAPRKYLTLIFLFPDIFFSISPDIVESPKISEVPFLHSSLFGCTVLLSALLIFSVRADWISFLVLTCSSECFTVCSTSITGQFLVSELRGDSCLEGLSITTSKSKPDGLLEKPSTVLLLRGISCSRIIGEDFFLFLNLVSFESSLNGVMLIGNFFFRVRAAKVIIYYVIIIWCFNGSNNTF